MSRARGLGKFESGLELDTAALNNTGIARYAPLGGELTGISRHRLSYRLFCAKIVGVIPTATAVEQYLSSNPESMP